MLDTWYTASHCRAVEVYIAELGTADRETIRTNIERNRGEFEQEPDYEQIIGAVMAEVGAKAESN